jgi:cyclopropane-fatty-acyl-phospholipid synthase
MNLALKDRFERILRLSAAGRLAGLVTVLIGGPLPVRLRAWDGSVAGPDGGPMLVVNHRRAVRRLLWQPTAAGLAQAYIAGEIDVDGDLTDGLRSMWRHGRTHGRVRIGARDRLRAVGAAAALRAVGPRPAAPSAGRGRVATGRHDAASTDFSRLILDSRMANSCAYFTSEQPGYDLERAQRDKLELVCAKLGLERGMRMLDVGCGWGALAAHAARHYGVAVTAVTPSAAQRDFAVRRVAELNLAGAVEIRLQDHPDVTDGPYDAIATIERGEHVAPDRYPEFAAHLFGLLAPRGRLLVQQTSRGPGAPGGTAFVEAYVAPGAHLRPVGETAGLFQAAGFEVRDVQALREHYVRTMRAWLGNLEARWAEAVDLAGEPVARTWRLRLAGGALAFELGRMGVDQILAVRPAADGSSGMPAVRS